MKEKLMLIKIYVAILTILRLLVLTAISIFKTISRLLSLFVLPVLSMLRLFVLLPILSLSMLPMSASAVVVMPEIRKTVAVSKTDITRVSCEHGQISSINYAAGTGLTHKKHENGKNVILLFQQLVNAGKRTLIDAKVNFLISCDNEYYPLILDPQPLSYQPTIRLELPEQELQAKQTIKDFYHKTREQALLELIKKSRNSGDIQTLRNDYIQAQHIQTSHNNNIQTSHNNNIQTSHNNNIQTQNNNKTNSANIKTQQQDIYLGDLQLRLVNQFDVIGSHFQVQKFVVIANKTAQTLTEKIFINAKLSNFQIAALSLDDYKLSTDKNWTYLHIVLDKGEAKW